MNHNSSVAGLASLVQSRGRGDDTVLVHMTPGELKGLQSLALAHGGQLTLNPDTGLYEAGFLKKLLPTLIGAILTPLSGGLINPFTAGLLVGGVEGIRTGDLGKGLMAGLGAFGGAGLSSALAGAGAASAAGAGTDIAAKGVTAAAETAGTEAAKEAAKQAAMREAAQSQIQKQIATRGIFGRLPEGVASFKNIGAGAGEIFKTGGAGLGGIGGMGAAGSTFGALPGGMFGKAGLTMTAANALSPDMEVPGDGYQIDDSYYESGGYDPSTGTFRGGQWRKGYPGFPGYADGGSVMPRPNYNYPQAGVTRSSYAPNLDYTRPREVVDGYGPKIDPFTGEELDQKFADGGAVDQPVNVIDRAAPQPPMGVFPQPTPPSQMEQYYQSLLAPPQQTAADPKFAEYLQNLNKFVTSPVEAPKPPPTPPGGTTTPPGGTKTPPGEREKFDPSNFDLSNFNFGDFMNSGYGDIAEYLASTGQTGASMKWDPAQGRFVSSTGTPAATGATAATAATGTTTTPSRSMELMRKSFMGEQLTDEDKAWMAQTDAENERNFKAQFGNTMSPATNMMGGEPQINSYMANQPSADFMNSYLMQSPSGRSEQMPDFSQVDYAGDNSGAGLGDLSSIWKQGKQSYKSNTPAPPFFGGGSSFYTPSQQSVDYAGGTPGFDMGNVQLDSGQMGDMGGYASQFQGFQPMPTDFGSTYQAPAMGTPMFGQNDFYAPPQQTDFGSMGNYGLGALGQTYSAPTFQSPSMDFSSPAPAVPTTSYSAPMTTGAMSTGETAPQFGFGNSDVLYGQSALGGGEPNIFGFAGGGSIQKAAAGKLVTGDGDGMSDDIRANINGDQEARLADGEFVIPADVVSHIGNGSTDAGAEKLYTMMDRIRKARTGRTRQAPEIDADKYLPA